MFDKPEVLGRHYGYECRLYPTIMDGRVFRWGAPGPDNPDEVSASRNGVIIDLGGRWPLRESRGVRKLIDFAFDIHKLLATGRDSDEEAAKTLCRGDRLTDPSVAIDPAAKELTVPLVAPKS